VAIKLLPPALAAQAELRERFLREARVAAKLSHPNIVPIHAVEQLGDLVFFVMAYVEGETLGHRVRTRGPLTPAQATRMLQEVAWALAYAHVRGIVHRDIKPENILLEAGTGRALVTDFGIARATETAGGTQVGEILGTAHYMSPEQACGERVDGRSDLYSLGVVGFFAVSGRLPFDAPDVPALLAMHITRPPPPLAAAAPGIPGKIAQAVDRCLAKDPAERWPTGEAFGEALAESTALAREIPAPLRLWVTKGDGARGPLYVWTGMVGLVGIAEAFEAVFQGDAFSLELVTMLGIPWGIFLLYRLYQTQRAIAAGYGAEDMRLALQQALERRQEELAFEYDREPPTWARVVRLAAPVGVLAAVASVVGLHTGALGVNTAIRTFLVASLTALSAAIIGRFFPGKRVKARDTGMHWRLRFHDSWLGRVLFRFAGLGVKPAGLPAAAVHRPTELAIGMAAESLFEALPKETRRQLQDLPLLLKRLEADAQGMRARIAEVDALLAGVGERMPAATPASLGDGSAAQAVEAGRRQLRDDLRAEREQVAKQLAASVGALETIRLGLLRLKAGVGTVQEITADLSAARELANEIDVVAAGHEEAGRLLHGERTGG
jgi:serine/threonine-protein kinase